MWKSRDQVYAQITHFFVNDLYIESISGHKVVITNFLYFNCLKNNILYMVTKVQLITNETNHMVKKAEKLKVSNCVCLALILDIK